MVDVVVIRVAKQNGALVQAPGTNASISDTILKVTNLDAAILKNDGSPTIASQIVHCGQYLSAYSNTSLMLANDVTSYANAVSYVTTLSSSFVNTSQLTSNLALYQTSAGLAANVVILASNNATYFNGTSLATVNSAITGNAATAYTNAIAYSGNAGLAYSNAVAYVVAQSFVNTTQLSSNLSLYQTKSGLSANVATLTSNNSTYFNGVSMATVNSAITGNAATASFFPSEINS